MLKITTEAMERITQRLSRAGADDESAMRLRRAAGRWRLRLDHARPNDAAFSHEGRNVLLLDRSAARAAAEMVLEVRETETGPRLKLHRISKTEG